MSIHITVALSETAADLLVGYSAGAKLYLDSASSEGGAYSNVNSEALVAGTEHIEFWDSSGTSATWYKSRAGNSGGSSYGAYSDPFQATSLEAYASLMDLRESMELPDESRDPYLLDLLRVATEQIDMACGRKFLRDPQVSGDTVWYVDIVKSGRNRLVGASNGFTTTGVPLDIISITTLGIRDDEFDSSYTTIAASDTGYYLDAGEPGFPFANVSLSPAGTDYTSFPVGYRGVELVGTLGFSAIPEAVRNACLDMAREAYRQGPGGGPAQVGTNTFGAPVYLTGFPNSFRKLIAVGSPYLRHTYTSV